LRVPTFHQDLSSSAELRIGKESNRQKKALLEIPSLPLQTLTSYSTPSNDCNEFQKKK
jgi:hypothetical protein